MNLSKTPPFTANEQVILVLVIFLDNLQRCRGRRCFRVLPCNKRRGCQNSIGSWTWTERHGFLFIRMVRHKQFLVCALLYSVVVSEPDPLSQTIGHGRLQTLSASQAQPLQVTNAMATDDTLQPYLLYCNTRSISTNRTPLCSGIRQSSYHLHYGQR